MVSNEIAISAVCGKRKVHHDTEAPGGARFRVLAVLIASIFRYVSEAGKAMHLFSGTQRGKTAFINGNSRPYGERTPLELWAMVERMPWKSHASL